MREILIEAAKFAFGVVVFWLTTALALAVLYAITYGALKLFGVV